MHHHFKKTGKSEFERREKKPQFILIEYESVHARTKKVFPGGGGINSYFFFINIKMYGCIYI